MGAFAPLVSYFTESDRSLVVAHKQTFLLPCEQDIDEQLQIFLYIQNALQVTPSLIFVLDNPLYPLLVIVTTKETPSRPECLQELHL